MNIVITPQQAAKSFSSSHFFPLNKDLIAAYGPNKACFLTNLIDKYLLFCKSSKMKDDWFYQPHHRQMKSLKLNEREIRRCKEFFRDLGILKTKMAGQPAREWYKIDFEILFVEVEKENIEVFSPIKSDTSEPIKSDSAIKETLLKKTLVSSKEEIEVLAEPIISQSSFSRKKPAIQPPKVKPTKKKKEYPIVPKDHPVWELLSLWNKHPACPTTHKLTFNSGLINHVKGFYDELTNGIFFRGKSFKFQKCSNFFENKVNEQMIQWEKECKKFSHNEIISGLRKSMLSYIKGYSPSNKEKLPQSLPDLFFIEYHGISLFIDAIVNPPKQLKDTITINEIDPDLTNEILSASGAERTPANVKKANEFIRLTKNHWDITTDTYDVNGYGRDFYKRHPSWYMFVIRFIEWMQDNAWPSKVDIGCFDAAGGVLRTWYEYLRKEYSDEDCDFKIIRSAI